MRVRRARLAVNTRREFIYEISNGLPMFCTRLETHVLCYYIAYIDLHRSFNGFDILGPVFEKHKNVWILFLRSILIRGRCDCRKQLVFSKRGQ